TIEIKLDRFNPHEQPSNVEGVIALHGVKKKVQIEINIFHISPLVKAEGRFNINQTDFQIRPYKLGSLEVANQLEIRFQLFFCEFHTEIPKDDTPDSQRLFEILKNEDITILREPTFFGCQELKDKQ
ncbi:MAG: YceI family protein, partial [SAR324 cluster bacterium]|nr:YceI family protein [SAR324 cluster bacterium]